jgi:hypothetical protein
LLLAWWTLKAMLSLAGEALPRVEAIAFDRQVLAFTVALAFMTPLILV